MAINKNNWVRGNNLAVSDFNFDDAGNVITVKTGALSSVAAAIAAAATPDASGTVAGKVNLLGEQVMGSGNKVFQGAIKANNFHGLITTSGAIHAENAELHIRTVTGPVTFNFVGAIINRVYSFVLELNNGGSAAVTWPTGVRWENGTPPVLTASGTDILGFYSHNGGVVWHGILLSKDSK